MMDTKKLIAEAKARFKHQENKIYLKEKYSNRLTFAHSGGMWTATPTLIGFLSALKDTPVQIAVQDNFDNPVLVDAGELLAIAVDRYTTTMQEWANEYKELSKNR